MAAAVENSAVVLVAVSQKYKNSNSCRTEATYAYTKKKPIIPLIVESDYIADGWLGALIGTFKYFKLTCESSVQNEFRNIQKEIKNRGLSEDNVNPASETQLFSGKNVPSDDVDCPHSSVLGWTADDVEKWLRDNLMSDYNSCMKEVNGEILVQMVKLSKKTPEFFYSQLKMDFGMNLVEILKFVNALEKLNI
ncbi:uncharacterized protein LOC117123756 [Anneissia japonica]|uniref:uncharacterized protein LOC117123756 n=1 Tax=Anneissia japonica TaxID=1529436 RepID=UPI0014255896|nr:uncharacterized protein LOC117123756 [Anneissia japonica]